MRLTVNQPVPFPAIYIMERILVSDVNVALTTAQFVRNLSVASSKCRQNAYEILLQGKRHWLVVPVLHEGERTSIGDAQIDYSVRWVDKHLKTIQQAYSKTPHFEEVYSIVETDLCAKPPTLGHLNQRSLISACQFLDIRTLVLADTMLDYVQAKGAEWMVQLCIALKATDYYCGKVAIDEYLNLGRFASLDITVTGQEWIPSPYPQTVDTFEPNLSVLDLMFNTGCKGTSFITSPTQQICTSL